ncbi:MAG: isoprenoid biosynthesis glyoxalase ElbB [Candidatus Riflebacteria bacterium]|nr:isoprenoid biosynthesis glyoxalase ElbB [Candidatus Riflebacteria bacterium]
MKKIGVVLGGCGVMDGAEIHESVFTLLAIDRAGAKAVCLAPNVPQMHVVNHATGQEATGERRNVLEESARIARGEIKDLKTVKAADLDALVFPGGYGAAKNLCDFAVKGGDCTVQPEVARLVKEMRAAGKPMGFICIAPAIAAKVLGVEHHVQVTIGTDAGTAQKLVGMGARHVSCAVSEIAVDQANKVVTTAAYMLAQRISEVADGIDKLIKKLVEMA